MVRSGHIDHGLSSVRNARVFLLLICLFCFACGQSGQKNEEQPATPAIAEVTLASPDAQSGGSFDLTWMPESTELVVQLDVQGILNSPLLNQTGPDGQPSFSIKEMPLDTGLGLDFKDLKSISVGLSGVSQLDPETLQQGEAAFDPLKESSVAVFTTLEPVDAVVLANIENVSTADHNGHPYFKRSSDDPDYPPLAIYLPGKNTIVVGPEAVIQRILDSGPGKVNPQPFNFINPQSHLAIAFVPLELNSLREAAVPANLPADFEGATSLVQAHGDRFGLELSLKEDLNLSVKVHCDHPDHAAKLGQELNKVAQYAQRQFADNSGPMGMLATLIEPLVTNLSGKATGSTAAISTNLPAETAKTAAGMLPMMLMMAGLGGGNMQMSMGDEFGSAGLDELLATAQSATVVEGLSAEATLKAAVHWNNSFFMSNDQSVEPPQQLAVDFIVQGKEFQHAVAYGDLSIDTAQTDAGHLRQVTGMSISGNPKDLLLVDRENSWTPLPEDGVLINSLYHHPVPQAKTIKELSGHFKILVAGQQSPKTLKDAVALAKTGIEDPELKAAGVQLILQPPQFEGSSDRLALSTSSSAMITNMHILNKAGQPDEEIWPQTEIHPDGSCETIFSGNEPGALNGVSIQFTLNTDIQPYEVKFAFNDLEIPAIEKEATPEQLALVTWVPSTALEELPEGLRVESQARWTSMTNFDSEGKPQPRSLELPINLVGGSAANTIALGEFKLDQATTDVGELAAQERRFGSDPLKELVDYSSMMFLSNAPANGAQAVITFSHPEKPPTRISEVTGQLTFVTATDSKTIRIPEIMSKMDSSIENTALADLGVKLLPRKAGDGFHLEVQSETPFSVGDIELVDPNGRRLTDVYPGKSDFNGKLTYTFLGEGKLPADCGLKITLNLGIEKHTIPFSFKGIQVPVEPPAQEF